MPSTIVKTKTWICQDDDCPFRWQFSGEAANSTPYDLTEMQLREQFPEQAYIGLQAGYCPNCWSQGRFSKLGVDENESNMTEIVVADDSMLEATPKPELDADGNPVMEQVDSRYELRVNQSNGQIYTEEVPIMAPKMRSLTTKELTELKEQRDRNLDELEKLAVKEVDIHPE